MRGEFHVAQLHLDEVAIAFTFGPWCSTIIGFVALSNTN